MYGKLISAKPLDTGVSIQFESGQLIVDVISDEIINFFSPITNNDQHTVALEGDKHLDAAFYLNITGTDSTPVDVVEISTDSLTVKISSDMMVDIYDKQNNLICGDYRGNRHSRRVLSQESKALLEAEGHNASESSEQVVFSITKALNKDAKFYGLGDKTGYLNKRGYEFVNWNTDYPQIHAESVKALYKSIPFIINLSDDFCYGLFFDNTYKNIINLGQECDDYFFYDCFGGNLNYYFIGGANMAQVVMNYTYLTGHTPLPQLWTLGYQQSRWSYASKSEAMEVAKKFREHSIPCDAIHLDIDYMEGFRIFTWDEGKFGDALTYTQEMKAMGYKTVTIIDPGTKVDPEYFVYKEGIENDFFVHDTNGEVYENAVWPGTSVFPDFGKEDVRIWWSNLNAMHMQLGIDGIWNDMNEPASFNGEIPEDIVFTDEELPSTHAAVHNIYGHNMARGTYAGIRKATGKRPFVITRAAYSGTQKYSTVWTGDNMSLWSHIQFAIPQLCNLGLSGFAFAGTDIGGFSHDTTKELLCRWIQVGAFSPLMRNHSASGSIYQEPWQFDQETIDIYRKFVNLRYALLPYLYDLMQEASITGIAPIRPVVLHYSHDPNTYDLNDEFMFGENMLVAPVVAQGSTKKMVYLPAGTWYDFYNRDKYEGGQYFIYDAPLDVCPIFVKEGAIIPTYEVCQYIGEKPYDTLKLLVFPGQGTYTHYIDNGEDYAYEEGECTLYRFTSHDDQVDTEILHKGYREYGKIILLLRGYGVI